MIRAFVAIPLPEEVTDVLELAQEDLPVGRPVLPENMHLTLVFLGEVREPDLEEIHLAFERLHAPRFELRITGLDQFGGSAPRVVHAAIGESAPLRRLQAKLQQAAREVGLEVPARRFVPHVTLCRLKGRRDVGPAVAAFVARRSILAAPPFTVDAFCLYRSKLGRDGPVHDELARYPLDP